MKRLPSHGTPKPGVPRPLPRFPHCKGCGTAVAPGVNYCPECEDKQGRTPEYVMNLHTQKRPPYERPSAVNPEE